MRCRATADRAAILAVVPALPMSFRRWAGIPVPGGAEDATGDRGSGRPAWAWLLGSRAVVGYLIVVAVADLVIWRWQAPYAVEALFDEPAHAATGLIALTAFQLTFDGPVVLAVLAGALLIDADHWPHVFGTNILQHGVPRPYTHSLGTLLVLSAVAVALRSPRARRLLLVATAALALHFFRDAAEPGGPGVSLLWPISDQPLTVAYGWYAGALTAFAAVAVARRRQVTRGMTPEVRT